MTWQFMKDSIAHEGKTLYRLAGTHETERTAEQRAARIRQRKRAAVVRSLKEPRPNGRECFAIYAEAQS